MPRPPTSLRGALRAAAARRAYTAPGIARAPPPYDPQLGDYPNLPAINAQELPPLGPAPGHKWWDMQNRRNLGDPVHMDDEAISMWGPDIPRAVAPHVALRQFSYAVLAFAVFGFGLVPLLAVDSPVAPRSYPFSGLVAELGGLAENKAREEQIEEED